MFITNNLLCLQLIFWYIFGLNKWGFIHSILFRGSCWLHWWFWNRDWDFSGHCSYLIALFVQPVSTHESFALQMRFLILRTNTLHYPTIANLLFHLSTQLNSVSFGIVLIDQFLRCLWDLNLLRERSGFHSGCSVHSITEDTVLGHLKTNQCFIAAQMD